jgi:hypothetical protein
MQSYFTDFTHFTNFTDFTHFAHFTHFSSRIPAIVGMRQSLRKPTGNSDMEDCAESQREAQALRSE